MAVAILIHPLSVKFWIIQILLSYFPNSQVRNILFYFIELLLVHPRKPKCFCWKQNVFPPKYRSLVRQRKILWNKLCVL